MTLHAHICTNTIPQATGLKTLVRKKVDVLKAVEDYGQQDLSRYEKQLGSSMGKMRADIAKELRNTSTSIDEQRRNKQKQLMALMESL